MFCTTACIINKSSVYVINSVNQYWGNVLHTCKPLWITTMWRSHLESSPKLEVSFEGNFFKTKMCFYDFS